MVAFGTFVEAVYEAHIMSCVRDEESDDGCECVSGEGIVEQISFVMCEVFNCLFLKTDCLRAKTSIYVYRRVVTCKNA